MRILVMFILLLMAIPAVAAEKRDLLIIGGFGKKHFQVEVAEDSENQQHGLMGRKKMKNSEGMLFYFGAEKQVEMWMKDTLIPLDMLFIEKGGRIIDIAENAEPMSKKMISPDQPVIAVLELKGGTAKKLKIKVGDRVVCEPMLKE